MNERVSNEVVRDFLIMATLHLFPNTDIENRTDLAMEVKIALDLLDARKHGKDVEFLYSEAEKYRRDQEQRAGRAERELDEIRGWCQVAADHLEAGRDRLPMIRILREAARAAAGEEKKQ